MKCSPNSFWCLLLCLCPLQTLAATIKGPSQVTPGMPAVFTMLGLPPEHRDKFSWQVFAAPPDAMVLDLADRSGNPVLLFWSRTSGKCAVIADVNIPPDQFELLVHEFVVGSPEPGPGPKPDPEPEPPVPVQEVSCLLLYESEPSGNVDRDGWTANIITSQKIRRLASSKLHLIFADKDELDEKDKTTPAVKTWIAYIERHKLSLPRLFFINERSSELIATVAVPRGENSVDETVKLIRRYAP